MTKYLNEWSNTPGSNNFTQPDGWPEGITSDKINNIGRETMAVHSRWEKDNNGSVVTTGTQPAYLATLNQSSIAAYYDGLRLCLDFHSTNAGGAPTLDVNSIGAAKALYWPDGTALVANDITATMKLDLVYDGTNFQVLSARGVPGVPAANSINGTHIAIGSDAIGDILYYNGTDYVILAAGTDGYHLRAKGAAAPVWEAPAERNHIAGLELSGATDTLSIAAGEAMDTTNVATMPLAAFTKNASAAWVVGTGNGSLDTGVYAASTLYYVWLIQRVDTGVVDVLTSVSGTIGTITLPTNYTLGRLIGAFVTDATPDILAFQQVGDYFRFTGDVIADIADATITANTFEDGILSVPRHSLAHIYVKWSNPGATGSDVQTVCVRTKGAADASDELESIISHRRSSSNPVVAIATAQVLVDTASTVQYAGSETSGTTTISINTLGFTMLTRSNPI